MKTVSTFIYINREFKQHGKKTLPGDKIHFVIIKDGEFQGNLTSQGFILPTSKIQCTVENNYDQLYATAKIADYTIYMHFHIVFSIKLSNIC